MFFSCHKTSHGRHHVKLKAKHNILVKTALKEKERKNPCGCTSIGPFLVDLFKTRNKIKELQGRPVT